MREKGTKIEKYTIENSEHFYILYRIGLKINVFNLEAKEYQIYHFTTMFP